MKRQFTCESMFSDFYSPSPKVCEGGGPQNSRNLNVALELEVVARCAARCRESTQYSSILPRAVSLG
jgi:hypothetical protein